MTRLEELERAIASLSEDDYREFRRGILERDWEKWDRQIEEDSKAGKLNLLVEEAREAKDDWPLHNYGSVPHRTPIEQNSYASSQRR